MEVTRRQEGNAKCNKAREEKARCKYQGDRREKQSVTMKVKRKVKCNKRREEKVKCNKTS